MAPDQIEETAQETAQAMGARISEIMAQRDIGTLIVFGGDTLAAAVKHLGIHVLEPLSELVPGVVLCRTSVGGKTLNLVTKAGSFGAESLAEHIEKALDI